MYNNNNRHDKKAEKGCTWLDKELMLQTDLSSEYSDKTQLKRKQKFKVWGIDWPIEDGVGWGTIGRNMVSEAMKMGITAIPLRTVDAMNLMNKERVNVHPHMRLAALLSKNHVEKKARIIDFKSTASQFHQFNSSDRQQQHSPSLLLDNMIQKYPKICAVHIPFPVFYSLGRYGPQNVVSTLALFEQTRLKHSQQRKSFDASLLLPTEVMVGENSYDCSAAATATVSSSLNSNGVYWGSYNVAIMFSENSTLTLEDLATLRLFDVVLGGSTWNVNMLRRYAGLPASSIALFRQGIDPSTKNMFEMDNVVKEEQAATDHYDEDLKNSYLTGFKHRAFNLNHGKDDGKFYIFSGGKLEFRKGQDLVIRAFQDFLKIAPKAVLVVAWANPWSETVKTINESHHTNGHPKGRRPLPHEPPVVGALDLLPWLQLNNIPSENVLDLGVMNHAEFTEAMKMADVGLFPNRCEGGTNLVAMEAASVGLPLILSTGTGHADLIEFLSASKPSPSKPSSSDREVFSSKIENKSKMSKAYIGLFGNTDNNDRSEHGDMSHIHAKERAGWNEPVIEEIVAALTYFYEYHERGSSFDIRTGTAQGAEKMRLEWSWRVAVEGLHRVVERTL